MRIPTGRYRAFVFDMDGVLTDTAQVHRRAWTATFAPFLRAHGDTRPFTADDYRRYVDGRSRVDGITSFLASRDIRLPVGRVDDPPDRDTVSGLANRKNELFLAEVGAHGVAALPGAAALLARLRAAGVSTAVVTASRNADRVLAAAGLADLFDARIDGNVARAEGLAGKPDPATFLAATARLGVDPGDAVVLEDALAGVRAGARGGFGLVVGVGVTDTGPALSRAGADVVISDLRDVILLDPDPDCDLCAHPGPPEWTLSYFDGEPEALGTREALLTLGNGYLATRGAVPEAEPDGQHYPGTYVAGVYNRLVSTVDVDGHRLRREDESVVNLPHWLPVTVRPAGGAWLDCDTPQPHHHLALDLRRGILRREVVYEQPDGRRTRLRQQRLVSMATPHLAALETVVIAENWSGTAHLRSTLDARVRNGNVSAFLGLADQHLTDVSTGLAPAGTVPGHLCWLVALTSQSRCRLAFVARLSVAARPPGPEAARPPGPEVARPPGPEAARPPGPEVARPPGPDGGAQVEVRLAKVVGHEVAVPVAPGSPATLEKVVVVYTSKDRAISEPLIAARQEAAAAPDFAAVRAAHEVAWEQLWRRCHIGLEAGAHPGLAVNLDVFHTLQTLSPHTAEHDVGVPARGLHGEGYRGHVFWDGLFVFPFFNLRLPALSRSLLRYRYRRLPQARRLAAAVGRRGALFPWQSGSDGREETPAAFYNPLSRHWMPDHSRLQYHVNLEVAYNVWHYWQVTGDLGFMVAYGAEMLAEIARFWASMAVHDGSDDRYDIRGVMGPDEFHDGYPGREGLGVDNSAYVNVMTAWVLARAHEAYRLLGTHHGADLWRRLALPESEVESWVRIAHRLRVPFLSNGLLAQFDGYEDLPDLDWRRYEQTYRRVGRLDLILEAEGDDVRRYRVSKQADVLMLLYLFDAAELTGILHDLGYDFDPATIPAIVDYYLDRTSHGSTLSRVAHAWVLARTNRRASWRMLHQALDSDLEDVAGTTRTGIHLGAMAGALDILQRCYTGLDARNGALWLNPMLPDELRSLRLSIQYRNQWLDLVVDHEQVTITALPCAVPPITVHVHGEPYEVAPGRTVSVPRPSSG